MKHKYLRLKYIILILMFLVITSGCRSAATDDEIDSLNKKLDILSMLVYDGQLYVGSTMGLFKLNDIDELEEIELNTRIGFIYALFETKQGLLVGGMNGLLLIDREGRETVLTDMLPDKRVYTINKDLNNHIYVGTFDGLLVMDQGLEPINHTIELLSTMVNTIGFDSRGNQIMSSYNVRSGGLTIIEGETTTYYDSDSELSTINTTSMEMLEDSFFIGGGMYETGGFDKFELTDQGYRIVKSYTDEDGLAGPKVRSMLLLNKSLLVGSEYDGFSVLNFDNEFVNIESYNIYTTKHGLSHNEIKCMVQFDGFVYFGTKAGLSRILVSDI